MPDSKAGSPPDAPGRPVGLIQIDEALLALDVTVLREVIRCPPVLLSLPGRCSGIIGAVMLRGTIIPVLDLGRALGMPPRGAPCGVIIVLRIEDRVLGLLADAICGMAMLAPSDLQCLRAHQPSAGPHLSQYGFEVGGRIASLIDGAAICCLPDIPMVAEASAAASQEAAGDSRPHLLFDYAGTGFGIDAVHVEATVPRTPIHRGSLTVGSCLGVISYLGQEIPVVDTHGVLGLGPKTAPDTCEGVVVRFPAGGRLAFVIDAVRDIPRLAPDAVRPLPALVRRTMSLLKGMADMADGRSCLLIDEAALHADPHLSGLSRLCRPKPEASRPVSSADARAAEQRNAVSDTRPYLVYTAGELQTTPLIEVSEILAYPAAMTTLSDSQDGLIGLFHHRGSVVPLIHLAKQLGLSRPIDPTQARVLLMEQDGQRLGFIIDALHSVEPARWRTPALGQATAAACARAMTFVGTHDKGRLVWHQDLRSITQALLRAAGPGSGHAETATSLPAVA